MHVKVQIFPINHNILLSKTSLRQFKINTQETEYRLFYFKLYCFQQFCDSNKGLFLI